MRERLIILGASGHGKVVADIALSLNQWKTIAFLDDNESLTTSMGYPVIGKTNDFSSFLMDSDFIIAIGNNKTRQDVFIKLELANASIVTLVHPKSVIGSYVEIGIGTVIMAGVVINACTKIGKGCIINTSSSVDHDNTLSDFVHISPGAHLAGNVSIGTRTWIGMGSNIIQNVSIFEDVIIGAESVVLKSIEKAGTYVGNPVRRI